MVRKLTHEYVYNYFKENNCQLLETEYKNAVTKMRYICSCGNQTEIKWNNFQQGQRCKECYLKNKIPHNKITFETVGQYFEDNNCLLLSKEYKTVWGKLEFICSCGKKSIKTFECFRKNPMCTECSTKKNCGEYRKLTFEYVYNYFKDNGCELIETEYINSQTKMRYICSCGDICHSTFGNFIISKNCRKCGTKKMLETRKELGYTWIKSGEEHASWNHNLTKEERENKRDFLEYKDWRNSVYQRDNYTCQCCGDMGNKLNVHHLDGYNWCEEKRIDINNGVTLCEDCHGDFHKIYGYGDNTIEQFIKFNIKEK